jgi:hypothetical protein
MSSILADRVRETTSTTGTGPLSLLGPFPQFQSFVAGVGNGNSSKFVVIDSGNGVDWEIDEDCLVTAGAPDTLTRGTFRLSSTGSPISLAGTSTVWCDMPAALLNLLASIPDKTVVGNISGATGKAKALSQAELTALLNGFTSLLPGAAPASCGGTTNFLRADGTWAAPPGSNAYGPIYPASAYPVDTTGRLFPQFAPIVTVFGKVRGMAVKASLDADAIWRVSFQLPPFIPSGTCKLVLRGNAPATSGVAKVTPSWSKVGDGVDVSGVSLSAETQQSYTWSVSNSNLTNKVTLTSPPAAGDENKMILMDLTFNTTSWTLAQISVWTAFLIWE